MPDSSLFTQFCQAISSAGWKYHRISGREVVELGFEARHGKIHVLCQAFEMIGAIGVNSESVKQVPASHRVKLAELLMRTNLELTVGNFEMDWDSRRVYFRTTNLFGNDAPTQNILIGMVQAAVAEMDRMAALCAALGKIEEDAIARFDVGRFLRMSEEMLEQRADF